MSSSLAWCNLSYMLLFGGRKTRKTWWKNPSSRIKDQWKFLYCRIKDSFIYYVLNNFWAFFHLCSVLCMCMCVHRRGMSLCHLAKPIIINIIPFISYLIFSLTLAAWINYPLQLFQAANTLLLSFYFKLFCKLLGKCEYK